MPFCGFGQSRDYKLAQLQSKRDSLNIILINTQVQITLIDNLINGIKNPKTQIDPQINERDVIKTSKITMNASMRHKPSPGNNVICKIEKGESVDILSIENDYYKIRYKDQIGYINNLFIYDLVLDELAKEIKNQKPNKYKSSKYKNLSKKYGSIIARRIVRREIWIGMTDEMARISIGIPKDINRTQYAWGVDEQWVYGASSRTRYLYFENGILTVIQD